MAKVLVLVIDTGAGLQNELFPGDTKVVEKQSFIRLLKSGPQDEILALYPITRVIGIRFFDSEQVLLKEDDNARNAAMHQGSGEEGQQDSTGG